MNQRLQQFLNAENLSQSQFADTIDVARASVSHILSGRNRPSYDFIENTIKHFPTLNVEWLITGKGKMYKSIEKEPISHVTPDYDGDLFNLLPETSDSPAPVSDAKPVTQAVKRNAAQQETVNSPVTDDVQPKTQPTTEMKTLSKVIQSIENQKEITRITVYFSDNTFQEFH